MFGLDKKSDPMKDADVRLRSDALKRKFSQMTDTQLIMAMLIDHDSASDQAFYNSPLGSEAMKRCGHNPYEE